MRLALLQLFVDLQLVKFFTSGFKRKPFVSGEIESNQKQKPVSKKRRKGQSHTASLGKNPFTMNGLLRICSEFGLSRYSLLTKNYSSTIRNNVFVLGFLVLAFFFSLCYYLSYLHALRQFNNKAIERSDELAQLHRDLIPTPITTTDNSDMAENN